MEQDLHESYHPGIVDLDAGDSGAAGHHRQSDFLKQRKFHVNVERLGFETNEMAGNVDESAAQIRST